MDHVIHDLKTERQNISAGLPRGYKLIPVAFYITLVASVILSLYFYLSIRSYESSVERMTQRIDNAQREQSRLTAEQRTIVAEARRAEGIAKWLEGARALQPVTVAIGRSMAKQSTIAELSLDRNPEIPAHTFMQLKVDGAGSEQIETTLNSIYALNYQTYSAQQVKGSGSIDFQATLIYSDK